MTLYPKPRINLLLTMITNHREQIEDLLENAGVDDDTRDYLSAYGEMLDTAIQRITPYSSGKAKDIENALAELEAKYWDMVDDRSDRLADGQYIYPIGSYIARIHAAMLVAGLIHDTRGGRP